jgi:hypothetical protein
MRLKIVPMPTEIAESVRTTMKSTGYGFPAHRQAPTKGRAPCRHCLKLIRPDEEELILFTYDAFYGQGVPPLPGPVYIHADACLPFGGDGRIPDEYRGQPLTFEAFGKNRKRVDERRIDELIEAISPDEVLRELFEQPGVQYVHIRSTSAGCYLFRVERAQSTSGDRSTRIANS